MTTTTTQQTIKDITLNSEYWVITDPANGGRCLQAGKFTAAWGTQKAAKEAAAQLHKEGALAKGYKILKQIKD